MLSEIYVPQFATYIGDDRHIRFRQGLNVILGGEQAENSIGKSTLLLIVDYAFGGDAFIKSDAVHDYAVGDHEIFFTHEFPSGKRYFSRYTAYSAQVREYKDGSYVVPSGVMSVGGFRRLLKEESELEDPDLSWREGVGIFTRVSASHGINYEKPLNASPRSADAEGLKTLEKLFGVFQSIKQLEEDAEDTQMQYETLRNAAKLGLSSYISLKNKRDRKKAQTRLDASRRELDNLKLTVDQRLFDDAVVSSERAIEIKGIIGELQQKRDMFTAKVGIIERSEIGQHGVGLRQIEALQQFFPNVNAGRLEQIEHFHRKLSEILDSELTAQRNQYQLMIDAIDGQINQLRTELAGMGQTDTLSTEEWDKVGVLTSDIQRLQAQMDAWDKTEKLREVAQETSERLQAQRPVLIGKMTDIVNHALRRLNEVVDVDSNPPKLDIKEGRKGKQSYTFGTERDTGAGTRAKDVIILDLSILERTGLPFLIHDSTLLKNIGDEPIEIIMDLYAKTDAMGKQVFIAFDKRGSYSERTQRVVDAHTVVTLNAYEHSLYGRRWNKAEEEPASRS